MWILDELLGLLGAAFFAYVIWFIPAVFSLFAMSANGLKERLFHKSKGFRKHAEISPLYLYIPVILVLIVTIGILMGVKDYDISEVILFVFPIGALEDMIDSLYSTYSFILNRVWYAFFMEVALSIPFLLPVLLFHVSMEKARKYFCSDTLIKEKYVMLLSLISATLFNIVCSLCFEELVQLMIWYMDTVFSGPYTFLRILLKIIQLFFWGWLFLTAVYNFFTDDFLLSLYSFATALVVMEYDVDGRMGIMFVLLALATGYICKLIRSRAVEEGDIDELQDHVVFSLIYVVVLSLLASGLLYVTDYYQLIT